MSFDVIIKKKIHFRRLPIKDVKQYEIYAIYKDSTYTSGTRTELIEVIDNPVQPNASLTSVDLEYNDDATWDLPRDAYLDRDHQFYLYLNDFIINSIYYTYNRITRKITLDTFAKTYVPGDTMRLEYYQDIIERLYTLEEDCEIFVKPIFVSSHSYGTHNIII